MVFSSETEGVLSVDVADQISLINPSFTATTSDLTKGNVARNTFVIEGYGRKAAPGSVLKYGQSFRLRINPTLSSAPVYLSSQPLSHSSASKVSRGQLVSFSHEVNFDTVWIAHYADHNRRFEMEGQPVQANSELLIVHQATLNPLSSEKKHAYHNDFGKEYEIVCSARYKGHKKHEMVHEFEGKTTPDIAARGETKLNRFAILTAGTPELEELLNVVPEAETVDAAQLVQALRDTLLDRFKGPATMTDLGRRFRIQDRDRSGKLTPPEFAQGLAQIGFRYTDTEFHALCSAFDTNQDGEIDYQEFLRSIRGTMNSRRRDIVLVAFAKFDKTGDGVVALDDLRAHGYNGKEHPDVKAGKRTEESVVLEFLSSFDGPDADGSITLAEFCDYYSNLSAFIDLDEYFELTVTRAWNL